MKRSRYAMLLVAVAIMVGLMPAGALGTPAAGRTPREARRVAPASTSYGADAYEADLGDDTEDHPTDVTELFGPVGGELYLQRHTISEAPTNAITCDEDWFEFAVTPADILAGTSYLIEADSRATPGAQRIIEVYDPALGGDFNPSHPPVEGTWDGDLSFTGCIAPLESPLADWWHDDAGVNTVTFVPPYAGTFCFRVRPSREDLTVNYGSTAGPYTLRLKKGFMTRAAGTDRVRTSVRFSQELYPAGALTIPAPTPGATPS